MIFYKNDTDLNIVWKNLTTKTKLNHFQKIMTKLIFCI